MIWPFFLKADFIWEHIFFFHCLNTKNCPQLKSWTKKKCLQIKSSLFIPIGTYVSLVLRKDLGNQYHKAKIFVFLSLANAFNAKKFGAISDHFVFFFNTIQRNSSINMRTNPVVFLFFPISRDLLFTCWKIQRNLNKVELYHLEIE